jgi:DNA-binding NtrC family response regulator
MAKVLVLQDQFATSGVLTEMLEKLGHRTISVQSVSEIIGQSSAGDFDIVFIDEQTKSASAIKSLALMKDDERLMSVPVIVVTSTAKSDDVIEAMRLGAFDHLHRTVSLTELDSVIKRGLARPKQDSTQGFSEHASGEFLIGLSPVMRHVEKLIGMAAACDATVLVHGETGTGKDAVARTIHRHSKHKDQPLTVVDCTAVPEDYEAFGSLTPGAQGTVILDEIGDLNAQMQAMLVRALKEAPTEALPDSEAKLRIIATTQYDLINMVKEKRLREDLYYRLNVLPVSLPPLRERGSDILALAETFLQQARPDSTKRLSSSAAKILLDYMWPGNVRELQNLMYHLNVIVRSNVIEEADLIMITTAKRDSSISGSEIDGVHGTDGISDIDEMNYYKAVSILEKRLLTRALKQAHGSRAEAARALGVNRQLLYAKLKTHGLMDMDAGGDDGKIG